MKTTSHINNTGKLIIRTGDLTAKVVIDDAAATAAIIGELQSEIIHQREIFGSLPKCWQIADVFLAQSCPVVPGMKLIVVEGDGDREILVDEVGLSHLTVADKVEEDGGFWENIQPEDCANSPQAAVALRKRKAKDAGWETTDKNGGGSCVSG